jgi:hypothetical protein
MIVHEQSNNSILWKYINRLHALSRALSLGFICLTEGDKGQHTSIGLKKIDHFINILEQTRA